MQNKKQRIKSLPGFTLLEVLLVVAIIAVLAGIVIVAINPGKQLGDTRNSQRQSDVNAIVNATYQYMIDHAGVVPATIPALVGDCEDTATNEICRTGAADCTDLVDMSVLTANEEYIVSIPVDPSGTETNGTGYYIARNDNGRITACAPETEQGEPVITVTK